MSESNKSSAGKNKSKERDEDLRSEGMSIKYYFWYCDIVCCLFISHMFYLLDEDLKTKTKGKAEAKKSSSRSSKVSESNKSSAGKNKSKESEEEFESEGEF